VRSLLPLSQNSLTLVNSKLLFQVASPRCQVWTQIAPVLSVVLMGMGHLFRFWYEPGKFSLQFILAYNTVNAELRGDYCLTVLLGVCMRAQNLKSYMK